MNFIVKNHIIVYGFDARNQEITEEVVVASPSKKRVAVDSILFVRDKFILIKYAFDSIIYWGYLEEYKEE